MRFSGELAALGTAVCWAAGSNFFAAAAQRMGALVLNRLRITVAAVFLTIALTITHGSPWPTWASASQIGLLAVSGLIGFVLGDTYYFRSMLILGPGRGAMFACLTPIFTATLGVPVLGETLGPDALLGMAMILGGLFWILAERERALHESIHGSVFTGVMAGVVGALGQAVGFVISKLALRDGLDPLPATVIRIVAATVGVWILAAASGDVARTLGALRNRSATLIMSCGAFCGPFLGVTLSLFALKHTAAGIAASITAIYPILTLFMASRFHAERITARILVGAVVSLAGVIVLFLR